MAFLPCICLVQAFGLMAASLRRISFIGNSFISIALIGNYLKYFMPLAINKRQLKSIKQEYGF